ncbi:hypothetical protein MAR_023848 [Mya arenaria]|uniref:Uncharacterized protein n=1 Tax=Mya arenaria TaxID=6604 RepID=A0ABY7DSZ2_MYAAR|nr:hypothetical protein MAR_023848 [Mya arenaria]
MWHSKVPSSWKVSVLYNVCPLIWQPLSTSTVRLLMLKQFSLEGPVSVSKNCFLLAADESPCSAHSNLYILNSSSGSTQEVLECVSSKRDIILKVKNKSFRPDFVTTSTAVGEDVVLFETDLNENDDDAFDDDFNQVIQDLDKEKNRIMDFDLPEDFLISDLFESLKIKTVITV